MQTCQKHPDSKTMVPCLGCGRYFCRICDTPRSTGQYCPRCYDETLKDIVLKKEPRGSAVGRFFKSFGADRVKSTRGAERLERYRKVHEPEEKRGRVAGGKRTRRLIESLGARRDRARSATREWMKKASEAIPKLPGVAYAYAARIAREHFPIILKDREGLEGMPPLGESWRKLALMVASGALLWTLLIIATRHRNPAISIGVALLVAAGVTWALGVRFGSSVGVVTMLLAILSLAAGELVILMLYRFEVIKKLDTVIVTVTQLEKPRLFYGGYFYALLLYRFLPSAFVAFMVGWWPFPKRLSWRGFQKGVRS